MSEPLEADPMVAEESDAATTVVVAPSKPKSKSKKDEKQKRQPPYNVILLDDDDHTYEYVIQMLGRLFGHTVEKSFQMACEVDATGRVIVLTTTKEHAELKQDQIHAFGPDPLMAGCAGSMSCVIEPAPGS